MDGDPNLCRNSLDNIYGGAFFITDTVVNNSVFNGFNTFNNTLYVYAQSLFYSLNTFYGNVVINGDITITNQNNTTDTTTITINTTTYTLNSTTNNLYGTTYNNNYLNYNFTNTAGQGYIGPFTIFEYIPRSINLNPSQPGDLTTKKYVDDLFHALYHNSQTFHGEAYTFKKNLIVEGSTDVGELSAGNVDCGNIECGDIDAANITCVAIEVVAPIPLATPMAIRSGPTTIMTLTNDGHLSNTGNVNGASPTEIGYLIGTTSNIQTQLNGKSSLSSNNTFSGTQTYNNTINLNSNIISNGLTISPTELGYLDGTTSNIQTQISNIYTATNDFSGYKTFTNGLAANYGNLSYFKSATTPPGAPPGSILQISNQDNIDNNVTGTVSSENAYHQFTLGGLRPWTWSTGSSANSDYCYFGNGDSVASDPKFLVTYKKNSGVKISDGTDTSTFTEQLKVVGNTTITANTTLSATLSGVFTCYNASSCVRGLQSGVIAFNGNIATPLPFSIANASDITGQTGVTLVSQSGGSAIGSLSNINLQDIIDTIWIYPNWGIIAYADNNYTGTVLMDIRNTTPNMLSVAPSSTNSISSYKIYFNNVELGKY